MSVTAEPTKTVPRIYIGNLKPRPDLKERLSELLAQSGIAVVDLEVIVKKHSSCFALVACKDIKGALSSLKGVVFDERKLVVQREKKRGGSQKSSFGRGGWSRPKPSETPSTHNRDRVQDEINKIPSLDTYEVSRAIGDVISEEIEAAKENRASGDEVSAMLASAAAVSLLASYDAINLNYGEHQEEDDNVVDAAKSEVFDDDPAQDQEQEADFHMRIKQPLSSLLADYGEQDVDFAKMKPTLKSPVEEAVVDQKFPSRLAVRGKAPIHVELVSFGYTHGIPCEMKQGWSHAHPLPPIDCRELAEVPQYMMKQCGLSYAVKREVMGSQDFRLLVDNATNQVVAALKEAMADGHGHASPLQMTLFVGSESGRHRGVTACERLAICVRSALRENKENNLSQPVSVGTSHRDMDRRKREDAADISWQSKQRELDSEW